MPDYTLSQAADEDLAEIYRYTYTEFGEAQADTYFDSLEECLNRLAEHPEIGLDISGLRVRYRRFIHKQHSIYYKPANTRILIVRILGPGMAVEKNLP